MREMILSRVPGHYVFHYGEEIGGEGSAAIAWDEPERFDGLRFAIAFDRAGTSDVITHQIGGRTCSDECARSIAAELDRCGLPGYRPARGIFTDTANYADLIGECSNLSVGYSGAHSERESTDLRHAAYLLTAVLGFDESRLIAKRIPGELEPLPPRREPLYTVSRSWETDRAWWHYGARPEAPRRSWDEPLDEGGRAGYSGADADGFDYSRYEDRRSPLTEADKALLRSLEMVQRSGRRKGREH